MRKQPSGKHRDKARPAAGAQTPAKAPAETVGGAEQKERVAKRIARSGLCSRREAEVLVSQGRVAVNGRVLETPAVTVGNADRIEVDGVPLPQKERTRLWLFHKPAGLVTTARDPEGRPTVFSALPKDIPRVLSVGRLDINTEGLLLLTNDGGLARLLELPSTGWLRRYRVRAHGEITQDQLDTLKDGIAVEGILYGSIEATFERRQGSNVWITVALREGKNREVKKVLGALGLTVNRLIRISFGPFQLGDMAERELREIRGRMLRDQLGERLIEVSGADFDAPIVNRGKPPEAGKPADDKRARRPGAPFAAAAGKSRGKRPAKGQAGEEILGRLETRPRNGKPGRDRGAGKVHGAGPAPSGGSGAGNVPGSGTGAGGGKAGRNGKAGRGNADRRR
jgi:23S rRNA pseudouridine2605 synthase